MKQNDKLYPVDVVIETPKGSSEKYAYQQDTGFFLIKKILPAGMVFPYDFGFIPGTRGEDGDPLDILVLSEFPGFPGVAMQCRLIGGFTARQGKKGQALEENDRYVAVPLVSDVFRGLGDWKQVPPKMLQELEYFFINYNAAEGKVFEPHAYLTAKQAMKKIRKQTI
ncbi:inorganic diphosphatase [Taibaiella chishuiensis]|uniref:inorganic diphosphatase n=1 Tax=Taibaiella chishuiensis TaxID=1434707 RepID=A0A2P8D3B7_9BACT|nr:inorganic diphosphatase [Taibaiella chishuiensis]PSK91666.1 inorganic pyrophosphatase [Taibaiella chishuiensis]